jgi:hypothetical protein
VVKWKLTSESLLAKARAELYTNNFEGARKNWSKAAKIFQQIGPGDKPFSKQVGTWVRICELDAFNEAEYNGATGTILDIDLKDKESRKGTQALLRCTGCLDRRICGDG